jgi:hypothetical protein
MRLVPISLDEYHVLGKAGVWVMSLSLDIPHENVVRWSSLYFEHFYECPPFGLFTRTDDDEEG